jgi:hypothetical protein
MSIIKPLVQLKFSLTSRTKASDQIRKVSDQYLNLAQKVDETSGAEGVRVPKMIGVDEDMRNWSYYMLLEHNVIVNRVFTITMRCLANGKVPEKLKDFDAKKDVMPGERPGAEQVEAFRKSVDRHLQVVSKISSLRGTPTYLHPLFGEFDAHKWHCMFGFHLLVHLKQAKYILDNRGLVQSGMRQ